MTARTLETLERYSKLINDGEKMSDQGSQPISPGTAESGRFSCLGRFQVVGCGQDTGPGPRLTAGASWEWTRVGVTNSRTPRTRQRCRQQHLNSGRPATATPSPWTVWIPRRRWLRSDVKNKQRTWTGRRYSGLFTILLLPLGIVVAFVKNRKRSNSVDQSIRKSQASTVGWGLDSLLQGSFYLLESSYTRKRRGEFHDVRPWYKAYCGRSTATPKQGQSTESLPSRVLESGSNDALLAF